MAIYYIKVDTESNNVCVRNATFLDNFNDSFLGEPFFIMREYFHEYAKMDWTVFEEKLGYMANYFKDKYGPKFD